MLKQKKGFTLIELTIVTVIVVLLGTIAVPSFNRSIKKTKYEKTLTEVVSVIKEARNSAIIGKFTLSGSDLTTPKSGYGILFDKNSSPHKLITFIDKNEDKNYSTGTDSLLITLNFPEEIQIKSMSGTKTANSAATENELNNGIILFQPPQGKTVLNENSSNSDLIELRIKLERYDQKKSKTLKINTISGFIEND